MLGSPRSVLFSGDTLYHPALSLIELAVSHVGLGDVDDLIYQLPSQRQSFRVDNVNSYSRFSCYNNM